MKKLYILAGLLCTATLQSCLKPYAYISNGVHAPLLDKKGEIAGTAQIGVAEVITKSLQADYTVTNHLFVTGSYFGASGSETLTSGSDTYIDIFKYRFGELGGGYYQALANHLRYGAFATYGFGSSNMNADIKQPLSDYYEKAPFQRLAGTLYFGMAGDYFEWGIANRFSYVNYSSGYQYNFKDSTYSNYIHDGGARSALFMEPAVSLSVGYKYVKFYLQIGHSFAVSGKPVYTGGPTSNYDPYYHSIFNFGVAVKVFTDNKPWSVDKN